MPRYDYRCRDCDARFEVSRGLDEPVAAVACPAGHLETTRVFSPVSVGGAVGGTSASAAPAPSGGGCCGGGCCG